MGYTQRTCHGGEVSQFVCAAFLFHSMLISSLSVSVVLALVSYGMENEHTRSRLAVCGSMTLLTSLTNCVTLEPTSPAPMRMTMLFGVRSAGLVLLTPLATALLLVWPDCWVLLFLRLCAIAAAD